ncbi:hypothetical protein [Enhygromyxa salina]|uniref:Uncharacterized protein n=1 Tax=Enhygromyxa salina TaxID=215803 RepID=A0A2S9YVV8_9BACT|nr:hypothetical protein [Enhygromyxa salina]PRQ09220.1 hypothetical protein ENSA7_12100 [Enhygromyxa salina]
MDRRGFLTTTFAGGLAVSGSACASGRAGQPSEVPLADDELERKLDRLDATLERMNHRHTTRWFHEQRRAAGAKPPTEADRERLTHEGELVRASLRSALLLSSVAELPEQNRSDPRVTARVQQIAGEADYALLGTLSKLRSLDASDLAALDREFAQGSLGMDVAEHIDELSAKLDVSAPRRLHLRRMAQHLDWRLEREAFSAVVSEVVDKVGRAVDAIADSLAGAGPGEMNGLAVALAGADVNWVARTREVVRFYAPADGADDAEQADAAPEPEPVGLPSATAPSAPVGPAPNPTPAEPAPWELEQQREQARAAEQAKLEKRRRTGLILTGTGAGLLVLGGVAVGAGIPFMAATGAIIAVSLGGAGMTAGIILLFIGIVLAVRAKNQLADGA